MTFYTEERVRLWHCTLRKGWDYDLVCWGKGEALILYTKEGDGL